MHHSNFSQKNGTNAEKHATTWIHQIKTSVPNNLYLKNRSQDIPYVVYPTVYGDRDQQLQVQPQSEESLSLLVANVVDHTGFIQLRLQLVSQIPWNYKEQRPQ